MPDDAPVAAPVRREVPRFGVVFDSLAVHAGPGPTGPVVIFMLDTADLSVGSTFVVDVERAKTIRAELGQMIDLCESQLAPPAQNGKRIHLPGEIG